MPKAKTENKTADKKKVVPAAEEKIIDIDPEIKDGDMELVPGEESEDDPEDDATLDDDEVDPFKDKWEE